MNVIIDYGVGNLFSLINGFKRAGVDVVVRDDIASIAAADVLILPGVGAFKKAMQALKATGLVPYIKAHVANGKPLLGICLGMQLLYETSEEFGSHQGLELLKGKVEKMRTALPLPHMGWNALTFHKQSDMLKYVKPGEFVYFVHSYYAVETEESLIATAEYDEAIPAIVNQGVVTGMQFHPEKSGAVGLRLLKGYMEMVTC